MRISFALLLLLSSGLILPAPVRAESSNFADGLNLEPLETLSVQHRQTLKTLDSYARQTLSEITGKQSLDGHPAVFAVLDICARPEAYVGRNLIKIKNAPLRRDFRLLESIDDAEKDRILKEGTISIEFWNRPDVRQMLVQQSSTAAFKNNAINQLAAGAAALAELVEAGSGLPPVALIAPPPKAPSDQTWRHLTDSTGRYPALLRVTPDGKPAAGSSVQGYAGVNLEPIFVAGFDLLAGWKKSDAPAVNSAASKLAALLPAVNPPAYPSLLKRQTEVVYNRLAKLTLPGAALYFIAFVLFLVSTRSGVGSLRLWGLRLMMLAFIVHTLGIGVRWWLVAQTHGNWFDGIPIKNQFESVLFSAWFGALVGLVLELRKSRGIFGAAASFVGWLSLTAIFATPYVTGREIGGEIGQVNGVLMSYWLYIHVTMVTASYALIGMTFALGLWWLIRYYQQYSTLYQVPSRLLSADGLSRSEREGDAPADRAIGATAGLFSTLRRVLFLGGPASATLALPADGPSQASTESFLARLDLCNLVVLQMAFWLLGAGIVLGAVWADESWGRPWGWDPKETFALVTWIVYLIVVHVRVATTDKAWWTAVLSLLGFVVMLFNWIGVNFFLVGLHSYA